MIGERFCFALSRRRSDLPLILFSSSIGSSVWVSSLAELACSPSFSSPSSGPGVSTYTRNFYELELSTHIPRQTSHNGWNKESFNETVLDINLVLTIDDEVTFRQQLRYKVGRGPAQHGVQTFLPAKHVLASFTSTTFWASNTSLFNQIDRFWGLISLVGMQKQYMLQRSRLGTNCNFLV